MKTIHVRFNSSMARLLVFFSSWEKDEQLMIETSTLLINLMSNDQWIKSALCEIIQNSISFIFFFKLIVESENEYVRCQCLHICARIAKFNDPTLLHQISREKWILGFMYYMNTKNITTISADIIFGYVFGLYSLPNELLPKTQLSKINPIQNLQLKCQTIGMLPLAIQIISDFPVDIAGNYFIHIERTVLNSPFHFSKESKENLIWDIPFLIFLMKRNRRELSSDACSRVLSTLYCLEDSEEKDINGKKKKKDDLQIVPLICKFIIATIKTGFDFSPCLSYLLGNYLMKAGSTYHRYFILCRIFEYLFYLPMNDSKESRQFYYSIPQKTLSFKSLFHQLFLSDSKFQNGSNNLKEVLESKIKNISFAFGTRTTLESDWLDSDLAELFLTTLASYPDLLTLSPKCSIEEDFHPIFM